MRTLKLQMQITMDGFAAGMNGELDWMKAPDAKQLEILKKLTENMDTILLGRKTAEVFTAYWEDVVDNQPDNPEYSYAKIFVDTPKIIFSRMAKNLKGKNVTIENGPLAESVNKLKEREGKDLIVYGGANFVSELIKNKLIDELYLFVNPIALGNGLKIFTEKLHFELTHSTPCGNGIVVNQYKPGH